MPATAYMDIDLRRDHKMQIPDPTLSRSLGTPNACAMCHVDVQRVPEEKRQALNGYADWLTAARNGDQDVAAELDRVNAWAEEQLTATIASKHSFTYHDAHRWKASPKSPTTFS